MGMSINSATDNDPRGTLFVNKKISPSDSPFKKTSFNPWCLNDYYILTKLLRIYLAESFLDKSSVLLGQK